VLPELPSYSDLLLQISKTQRTLVTQLPHRRQTSGSSVTQEAQTSQGNCTTLHITLPVIPCCNTIENSNRPIQKF